VVDKPAEPGNWDETSGTGMFIYLIQKSIDKGYISKPDFAPVVAKAYAGIVQQARPAADGLTDIHDCSSIGIQNSFKDYIECPRELNTFAGVTSFILGTSIAEKQ
jgi:rhamnogalacturonyl hydrolase YesR